MGLKITTSKRGYSSWGIPPMHMQKNDRIYIAGHRGLVGSAIHRDLTAHGYTNILTRTRAELDLLNTRSRPAILRQRKAPNTSSSPPPK